MTAETSNSICPACRGPLIKNRDHQRFCSGACRARYWRVEKKFAKRLTKIMMGYLAGLPEDEQEARYKAFEAAIHGVGRKSNLPN